jgi:hypothetical protein
MADEGALAVHLDAVVAAHPAVSVGSYPRFDAVDYRVVITFESKDDAASLRAAEDLAARLAAGVLVKLE